MADDAPSPEDRDDCRDEFDRMVETLYESLRARAHRIYDRRLQGLSRSASSLVHDALVRLGNARAQPVDEERFVAAAIQLMRYEYLDYLKARYAAKRGGGKVQRGDVDDHADSERRRETDLVETVARVLADLEAIDPLMAEVVLLCDVRGWTMDRVVAVTGVSMRTLQRRRAEAHAWLRERDDFRALIA